MISRTLRGRRTSHPLMVTLRCHSCERGHSYRSQCALFDGLPPARRRGRGKGLDALESLVGFPSGHLRRMSSSACSAGVLAGSSSMTAVGMRSVGWGPTGSVSAAWPGTVAPAVRAAGAGGGPLGGAGVGGGGPTGGGGACGSGAPRAGPGKKVAECGGSGTVGVTVVSPPAGPVAGNCGTGGGCVPTAPLAGPVVSRSGA